MVYIIYCAMKKKTFSTVKTNILHVCLKLRTFDLPWNKKFTMLLQQKLLIIDYFMKKLWNFTQIYRK